MGSNNINYYLPIASQLYSNLMEGIRRCYAVLMKLMFFATFPLFIIFLLCPLLSLLKLEAEEGKKRVAHS